MTPLRLIFPLKWKPMAWPSCLTLLCTMRFLIKVPYSDNWLGIKKKTNEYVFFVCCPANRHASVCLMLRVHLPMIITICFPLHHASWVYPSISVCVWQNERKPTISRENQHNRVCIYNFPCCIVLPLILIWFEIYVWDDCSLSSTLPSPLSLSLSLPLSTITSIWMWCDYNI